MTYPDIAAYHEQLKALVQESGVTIITAVQVANPHRKVVDIGASWSPLIVNIDHSNILSVEVIEREKPKGRSIRRIIPYEN